jgi:ribonuclease R
MMEGNSALREKYAPLVGSLDALHKLYKVFHGQRAKRGAIDFETVETRILFDKLGKIQTIIPQERTIAHKMIEESMLAANVCAAEFIKKNKRVALFRVHERPMPEKLTALRKFLSELGLDLPGRKTPTAKDFGTVIDKIKDREDRHVIEMVLLRSLSQAQYTPKDIGHFGLSYDSYTHFTSPIRRYPDLITHRTILEILADKKAKKDGELEKMEQLGTHCSETERRSDEAVRDATLALKCHYMQDKVGEVYHGVISGVASFGLFVELKDIYVEGLIHVTALGDEYFNYDPAHHRMIGERSRTVFRLGDPCEVRVGRVDVEAKKIDLELLNYNKKTRSSSGKHPPSRGPAKGGRKKKRHSR